MSSTKKDETTLDLLTLFRTYGLKRSGIKFGFLEII
jgi:hypothetical protein